jgi:hypothetical protein
MGWISEARDWLAKAFLHGNSQELKLMALDDPDLAALWKSPG